MGPADAGGLDPGPARKELRARPTAAQPLNHVWPSMWSHRTGGSTPGPCQASELICSFSLASTQPPLRPVFDSDCKGKTRALWRFAGRKRSVRERCGVSQGNTVCGRSVWRPVSEAITFKNLCLGNQAPGEAGVSSHTVLTSPCGRHWLPCHTGEGLAAKSGEPPGVTQLLPTGVRAQTWAQGL